MTKEEFISKWKKQETSVYHLPFFDKWAAMNRVCNPVGKGNPRCKCAKKGIKVYENWRRYTKENINFEKRNLENYKNYSKFLMKLIRLGKQNIKEIRNKKFRIERIDKYKDFEPNNICIIVCGTDVKFIPSKQDLEYCLS